MPDEERPDDATTEATAAGAATTDTTTTEAAGTTDAAATETTDGAALTEEQKRQAREAYERRQLQKKIDDLSKTVDGYKRRDEEARKAALTKEQQLEEEVKQLREQVEAERLEKLRAEIAAKFQLPPALAARIIGTDREAMEADAQELKQFVKRPAPSNVTAPAKGESGPARRFKRSELRDPAFFKANEKEIALAYKEGRIDPG